MEEISKNIPSLADLPIKYHEDVSCLLKTVSIFPIYRKPLHEILSVFRDHLKEFVCLILLKCIWTLKAPLTFSEYGGPLKNTISFRGLQTPEKVNCSKQKNKYPLLTSLKKSFKNSHLYKCRIKDLLSF